MIAHAISEIGRWMGADTPSDDGDRLVTGVSTDTRSIERGDLFFAIDGDRRLGTDFVAEAFRRGAAAAVSPRPIHGVKGHVLVVPDVIAALGAVARQIRRRLGIPVVAVTGTNGKTTTKDALRSLLSARYRVVAAVESFNNRIGVPLTICRADARTEILVLEIGTSAPGEIRRLGEIAEPTIGVVTSIGPGHLAGLGELADVLREKLALCETVRDGGRIFLNGEDARLKTAALPNSDRFESVMRYSAAAGESASVFDASVDDAGVSFRLSPPGPRIGAPLLGRANLLNLLGAALVARSLGVEESELADAARSICAPRMRMERRRVRDMDITFDCYNANPASMKMAIDDWSARPVRGRRVAVLGDMLELGDHSREYHLELGRRLAAAPIDCIYLVGEAMKWTAEALGSKVGAAVNVLRFRDALELRSRSNELFRPEDAILLKASRAIALERIFDLEETASAAKGNR